MSNVFAINIPLHPSKEAIFSVGILYFFSVVAVFLSDIVLALQIFLLLSIGLQGYSIFVRTLLLSHQKAIIQIEKVDSRELDWLLKSKDEHVESMELCQCFSVFSHMIILRFENLSKKHTLFIFSDNTTVSCFHHLLLFEKMK